LRYRGWVSIIYDNLRTLDINMLIGRGLLLSILITLMSACGGGGGGGGGTSAGPPVAGGNPPPPPSAPDPFLGQGPVGDVVAEYGSDVGFSKISRPMLFAGNRRYAGKVPDFSGPFHLVGDGGALILGCESTDNDCLDGISINETVRVVSDEPATIGIPFNDPPGDYRLFVALDADRENGLVMVTRLIEIRTSSLVSSDEPDREYRSSVILPAGYEDSGEDYPVIYMHDGQWLGAERVPETLEWLAARGLAPQVIVVGMHATRDRNLEYGVASTHCSCGGNRIGTRASRFQRFVVNDLMPHIEASYRVLTGPEHTTVIGFSLGGLSAMDLGWRREDLFGTVGAFSGSFWYFSSDADQLGSRAMHQIVRDGEKHPGQRFWFENGSLDVPDDRDGDGVNDMIEDTLDLVAELQNKGYAFGDEVDYFEVDGGYHNNETIAHALPHFLQWAYDNQLTE
jgi:enterochelin esterase-like enzyme